jgi:hypothetical protein
MTFKDHYNKIAYFRRLETVENSQKAVENIYIHQSADENRPTE